MSYFQSGYNSQYNNQQGSQFGSQYGNQYQGYGNSAQKYQVRDPYQSQAAAQDGFQVSFTDSEADDKEDNIYRYPANNKPNSNQRNTVNAVSGNQQRNKNYDNIYVDQDFYQNRDVDRGQEDEFYQASHSKPYRAGNYDFQDSQGQTLYRSKDEVPEKPIQLIAFDPSQEKFFLNQEAISIIKLYDEPISFVAVAGKYRTGKSFILNKIMNVKGRGFKVDASTQSCTQGIWMWSKPVAQQNKQIFFIDTEGSTSIEGNKKHDAKIFSLALLISSLFVFNSVGAIDDRSIQELQLTTQISRNIQVTNNVSQNDKLISQYTPKFIWLLRDFVLETVDSNGQTITPNQYLNNCLTDQTSISKQSSLSKKVREALLQFFRQRECFTMVRPATNEEDLKNLDNLPLDRLRSQFIRELNTLRNKIFEMADPKTMEGVILKPSIFAELIKKYVDQINDDGGIPDIKSAWDNIMEGEAQVSYEKAMQVYQELKVKLFPSGNTFTAQEIQENINQLRQQALKIFEDGTTIKQQNQYYKSYKQKLSQFIDNFEKQIDQENNQFADTDNYEIFIDMRNDLNSYNFDVNNIDEFHEKIKEWITRYNELGKGSKKMDIFNQFFPEIFEEQIKRIFDGSNYAQEIEDYKAQVKTLKQQIADAKKNAELQKNSGSADQKKQVETLTEQVAELTQAQQDQQRMIDIQKKKASKAQEEAETKQRQLDEKELEYIKLQKDLKDAQLAGKKKKTKCGCF